MKPKPTTQNFTFECTCSRQGLATSIHSLPVSPHCKMLFRDHSFNQILSFALQYQRALNLRKENHAGGDKQARNKGLQTTVLHTRVKEGTESWCEAAGRLCSKAQITVCSQPTWSAAIAQTRLKHTCDWPKSKRARAISSADVGPGYQFDVPRAADVRRSQTCNGMGAKRRVSHAALSTFPKTPRQSTCQGFIYLRVVRVMTSPATPKKKKSDWRNPQHHAHISSSLLCAA